MEIIIISLLVVSNAIILYLYVKERKNKMFYHEKQFIDVLNSMQQAMLFFDKKDKLIFYNTYAKNILMLKENHINLTPYEIFKNNKFNEQNKVFDINYLNRIYLVHVYNIQKSTTKNIVSKLLVLNNVTEARKIEETKKDFFSHASHELKSPLTAILGYSELITLGMINNDEVIDVIKRVYNQASHMSVLVEEMSTLSRLESITENEEDYEEVNLKTVLKDVIYTLEPFINEKNINLNVIDRDVYLKTMELDINKLFKNLIENAIKYSPSGSNINIKLFKSNNNIIFEVKDEGIGIAPEHIERIFERFYRIDKGRIEPGTGLGLAIVKHTLIKYNGKIDVKSKLNEGTTITIEFNS